MILDHCKMRPTRADCDGNGGNWLAQGVTHGMPENIFICKGLLVKIIFQLVAEKYLHLPDWAIFIATMMLKEYFHGWALYPLGPSELLLWMVPTNILIFQPFSWSLPVCPVKRIPIVPHVLSQQMPIIASVISRPMPIQNLNMQGWPMLVVHMLPAIGDPRYINISEKHGVLFVGHAYGKFQYIGMGENSFWNENNQIHQVCDCREFSMGEQYVKN